EITHAGCPVVDRFLVVIAQLDSGDAHGSRVSPRRGTARAGDRCGPRGDAPRPSLRAGPISRTRKSGRVHRGPGRSPAVMCVSAAVRLFVPAAAFSFEPADSLTER